MKLTLNNKTYLITDMLVVGENTNASMKFNVFDENYKFIKSFSCKDEDEFKILFTNYINNKSPFKL